MIDIKDKQPFAKGKRGIISVGMFRGKKVAIKEKHPHSTAIGRMKHEGDMLELLNRSGIGPTHVYHDDSCVVYEFVEGELIGSWIETAGQEQIKAVIASVFDQCFRMDSQHINKLEMTNPHKHIIITKSRPVLIDFERAKKSLNPRNVTQFAQYLISSKIVALLCERGWTVQTEKVMAACEHYKRAPSLDGVHGLCSLFGIDP